MVGFPGICGRGEPVKSNRITRSDGAHRATLSILSDDLPDRNSKFVITEDGREFRKSPLLSKWGGIDGQRGHRTSRGRMAM